MYECELAGLGEGVFFLSVLPSHSLQLAELCANHVHRCLKAWLVGLLPQRSDWLQAQNASD